MLRPHNFFERQTLKGNGMPAEAASGPKRPQDATESVTLTLARLEAAVKHLSGLAKRPRPDAESTDPGTVTADRDRLEAALDALRADHERLLTDYAALQEQRQELGQRLDMAIARLGGLLADSELADGK